MNKPTKQRDREIRSAATGIGMLVLGMALLVLGGMNLFANFPQIVAGQWQQNVLLSVALTVLFSAVPAVLGGWLVYRATATIAPHPVDSGKPK